MASANAAAALVAARDHVGAVGAVDDARIQDVEYTRVAVGGNNVGVQGSVGQHCPEVLQATIHLPGTRRQALGVARGHVEAIDDARIQDVEYNRDVVDGLGQRCCTGNSAISAYQPDGKTNGRGLSVNHELVLASVLEQTEADTLVCPGNFIAHRSAARARGHPA